ncbi:MAG TPA: hypothetical protein VFA90_16675 [Terriglobales bacterium]|nr:hypothetical protein [Terriglobales bacterium]
MKCASAKDLQRPGETRIGATPAPVRQIFKGIEAAIADTSKELHAYIKAPRGIHGNRSLRAPAMGTTPSLRVTLASSPLFDKNPK